MAHVGLSVPVRAVIFDLYGTLVPEFPSAEFYGSVTAMAEVLEADRDAFRAGWDRTAPGRQTGAYATMEDNVRAICAEIGVAEPSEASLAAALAPRAAMYRRWFRPRVGAIETLTAMRERGLPIGLISMCAPDTPPMWHASAFAGLVDVEVFSSEVGLRKPDPAIYRYACERLAVEPADVLYCGDGAYRELTGAADVGMMAVEIRDPDVDIRVQLRPQGDDWSGARVADLRDLLHLV